MLQGRARLKRMHYFAGNARTAKKLPESRIDLNGNKLRAGCCIHEGYHNKRAIQLC
ncbi:hypothetical protein [Amylolactobacillus amylophilus]|uniref:hypothetical protein n=1 Tax=Amylolactobacillus amylophilus TaxID=1603 RepID=UPI0020934F77|nr:hypothetical protein [Amylolactobacillus amylophilus]